MKKFVCLVSLLSIYNISMAQLTMQKADDGIIVVDGKKKVLKFQTDSKSISGKFSRNNYIHPLWGLNGEVLTEDFPADHLHHRGVFWAWHQVWIGEKRIADGWELKHFEQELIELEFSKQKDGSVQIKTEVDWKSDQWKKGGVKVPYLKENAIITVNKRIKNYRRIDFEIRLLALEEGVKLGGSEDKKAYGGFSVRMALPNDIIFSGIDGKVIPKQTAVKSEGYINIAGSTGGNAKKGGLVIADNAENLNYPQPWILREKNSMQNIVFPGKNLVAVSTNKQLILKYSLLVYAGKVNNKTIRKIFDL